ncbi:MAG: hypothetical protein K8S99_12270 [Planctomycetes bacterium]|nr:hypothetical protein [Planctomycetota bacterium]
MASTHRYKTFQVTSVARTIGANFLDIDLSQPIPPEHVEEIRHLRA